MSKRCVDCGDLCVNGRADSLCLSCADTRETLEREYGVVYA